MRLAVLVVALLAGPAAADMQNNEGIHAHVDAVVHELGPVARERARAGRLSLTLTALVPILGSYRLDECVFGDVRPMAYVFDWFLGGIVPAGLATTALVDTSLSSTTRTTLAWTAVGLYAATRIGVIVIGNLHISEYNRYLDERTGDVVLARW